MLYFILKKYLRPSWPRSQFGSADWQFCGLFVIDPTRSMLSVMPAAKSWSHLFCFVLS